MANYFWLVWYNAVTRRAPKHWALMVTYEMDEDAFGTLYQTVGDGTGWGRFSTDIRHGAQLNSAHGDAAYGARLFLGAVADGVVEALRDYCDAATDMINAQNTQRGVGELNCQDWVLVLVRSLEDARLLEAGTLARVKRCPRHEYD